MRIGDNLFITWIGKSLDLQFCNWLINSATSCSVHSGRKIAFSFEGGINCLNVSGDVISCSGFSTLLSFVAMEAKYSLNLLGIIHLSRMSIPSTINCGRMDFSLFLRS